MTLDAVGFKKDCDMGCVPDKVMWKHSVLIGLGEIPG